MLPRFRDRLRQPLNFDPFRLAADPPTVADSRWITHFVPQNYKGD